MKSDQELATPEAVRALVQVHFLLCRAEAEAAALVAETPGFAQRVLAGDLQDVAAEAHLIFPEGVMPAFDEWPVATTGADPLELAREAERLIREHPIAHFPPGMTTFVARLIDTIGDFS